MKQFIVLFVSILPSSPVFAAPAASPVTQISPNPRLVGFVAQPGFNKEACCKCWNDLYLNGADWEASRRPRPCDGDCVCDWCGTNNANTTYGTPCAGAGEPGAWGYCVANCPAPPGSSVTPSTSIVKTLPPTSISTPPTSIIETLPPTTLPSSIIKTLPPTTAKPPTSKSHEHTETSIIKTLPPTTLSTHTHPPTSTKPPPPQKEIRQAPTLSCTSDLISLAPITETITETSILYTISTPSSSESLPSITSLLDITIWFGSGPSNTVYLVSTLPSTGGTTIEGSGTLSFNGGAETFTYRSDIVTLTLPPASILTLSPRDKKEEGEKGGEEVMTKFPIQTTRCGPWTTGTNLPVETSWYNGGP
ncbi:uncharacterized protein PAC_11907 [Phialocephala subalpina]|uniref:Uncharacterized protein n=1 Tax=Phialocephala subalpina TaxID=576137 RepID=A0A1L7XAE9_9HELO|nr:uncharacterized protein PAC_11907 [Phialocephala subalpina]